MMVGRVLVIHVKHRERDLHRIDQLRIVQVYGRQFSLPLVIAV